MAEVMIGGGIHAARQTGAKRKPGKVAGETTKEQEIEIDGCMYPLNAGGNRSPLMVEWLTRMIRHVAAKLDEFGRVLIVRIDLHHPDYMPDNAQITRFIEAMSKQVQRKHGHKMGYVWAREQETAKAHHYHMALILDGDRVQQGIGINKLAAEVWGKMGGMLGRCANYWQMVGRGAVALPEVSHWLSYLTKIRGKGYRADYAQDFSTGRETTKARAKKRGQIIKVFPVLPVNFIDTTRTIGGLTVAQVREYGLKPAAAAMWNKSRSIAATARQFSTTGPTMARWLAEVCAADLELWRRLARARADALRVKVLAARAAGMPYTQISQTTGASMATAWRWVNTDPVLGPIEQAARGGSADREAEAMEMLARGCRVGEVVAVLGIDRGTLRRLRRRHGLEVATVRQGVTTPEKVARAKVLRAEGLSFREIAEGLDLDASMVCKLCKGIAVPGRTWASDEQKAQAKALRADGLSFREIAERMGISDGSARNWCAARAA